MVEQAAAKDVEEIESVRRLIRSPRSALLPVSVSC
jgi:hypothetical protein